MRALTASTLFALTVSAAALAATGPAPVTAPAVAADSTIYAGVSGVVVVDNGTFVVRGAGPFDRQESFEVLRRPDGGFTLLNTITAASGTYRSQGRFDFDAGWNAQSAHGIGVYAGKPVTMALVRNGKQVEVTIAAPAGASAGIRGRSATAVCDPSCFIDLSPSIMPMFVMTRHYDFARGGEQTFRWAGQDLDQDRTLSGGSVSIRFDAESRVQRAGGGSLQIRHFTFVESIPLPNGGVFRMNFDLWTDLDHAPLAFRARSPGGAPAGIFGLRKSHEDLRVALSAP